MYLFAKHCDDIVSGNVVLFNRTVVENGKRCVMPLKDRPHTIESSMIHKWLEEHSLGNVAPIYNIKQVRNLF
jgi:hypothetical protein